ncbi:hypothetical protein VP1G_05724 [Cytospora mali]|uniref:Uncharacterized protein n=1 Tax=Cytospora mali TaxID=578113 RepID=A0A194V3F8_CYTMA|nr:hypothetical protein VP1G_05724 [Valsa mali var. pyri (nom. inval.)]
MGLPLYRAPVESDLKPKLPKDPPTRARSTIRRTPRNINDSSSRPASASVQYYARRVGLGPRARARVISPPTVESSWTPWDNILPGEVDPTSQTGTRRPLVSGPYSLPRNTTQDGSGRHEPILREVITRNGPMSQEVVRYFGEHMARLYAGTSSRGTQDSAAPPEGEGRERSSSSLDDTQPSLEGTDPLSQPPATLARESTTRPSSDRDVRVRIPADLLRRQNEQRLLSMRRSLRAQEYAAMREARGARRDLHEALARAPALPGDATTQPSRLDGLGDRDRSLSPEGEVGWETLLSSITPDPQPPSVGTSFASTPAPASATDTSHSTAFANSANSSRTSLADGPDAGYTLREIGFAEVCESGGDNSETEGDEDEEARDNTLRRFGQLTADLTGRDNDDNDDDNVLEVIGGVESMQRIVRNLARRQDIPDEWWAEAGLSRTLGG